MKPTKDNPDIYRLDERDKEALGFDQCGPELMDSQSILSSIQTSRRELFEMTPDKISDPRERLMFAADYHGWLARLQDMEEQLFGREYDEGVAAECEQFLIDRIT